MYTVHWLIGGGGGQRGTDPPPPTLANGYLPYYMYCFFMHLKMNVCPPPPPHHQQEEKNPGSVMSKICTNSGGIRISKMGTQ